MSTHSEWKPWPHCGKTRSTSPSANSARQMAQSSSTTPPAVEVAAQLKENVGSTRTAFFLRPLLGGAGKGARADETAARWSHAQRAKRARPTTHMRVQRRTVRMMATSESKGRGFGASAADDRRNLAGERIPSSIEIESREKEETSFEGAVSWCFHFIVQNCSNNFSFYALNSFIYFF